MQEALGIWGQDDNPEQQERTEALARLNALGATLAESRKESVDFRKHSGIEELWDEDQDAYDGIDDKNRGAYDKATSPEGRVRVAREGKGSQSTVVVNITAPYVDMAAARTADMLLPTDDMPLSLDPTPIPELGEYEDSQEMQTFPDGTQLPAAEVVKRIREKATEIAERSETRIWDWMVESNWHAEVREVLEDAARIGTGCLKGPFPKKTKVKRVVKGPNGPEIKIEYETKPCVKRIDIKNLFPHKACGNNIHNGPEIWERDYLSEKQLKALKEEKTKEGEDEYLNDQIDLCLKEGPGGSTEESDDDDKTSMYEVWYCSTIVTPEDLLAAGCDDDCDGDAPALVTMVNDRVIKAAIDPLDSGEFIYDVITWQRKGNSWAGTGVARQVRTPQLMITAATRTMLNNAGLSSLPIWFMKKFGITPADGTGDFSFYPGKGFWVDDDVQFRSIKDVVHFLDIPNRQKELDAIIKYALDLAERLTNMPLMMQGQQGSATETVGGMQILDANSSSVLRRNAKKFDDDISEPKGRKFYEWLLLYGEDEDEKGDSTIVARGSALFERDAQNQAILQMGALVKDPDFGIDPKRWIVEALKAQKLNPVHFQYSEEEQKQIEEAKKQQPPIDPRIAGQIEVANVRNAGVMEKATLDQTSDMAELKLKHKIEMERLSATREENRLQREHDEKMKRWDREIAQMAILDKGKVDLTKKSMELNTQERLSTGQPSRSTPEVSTPPTEPAQHARDGKSYQE